MQCGSGKSKHTFVMNWKDAISQGALSIPVRMHSAVPNTYYDPEWNLVVCHMVP